MSRWRGARIGLVLWGVAAGTIGCGTARENGTGVGEADSAAAVAERGPMPAFTPEGALVRPEGWEAWVNAGTSIGLTYNEPASLPGPGEPPGTFLMVYLQPWAYRHFVETGTFADGTMFILAGADPTAKADPARGGFYQAEMNLLEVHLKWPGLHESGWGFYGFTSTATSATLIPGNADCYSCHRDNAATDHAFVQFYPPLRDRGEPPPAPGEAPGPAAVPGEGPEEGGNGAP